MSTFQTFYAFYTSELDLGKIYTIIKANAEKLFPGSEITQSLIGLTGRSSILIALPGGYRESTVTLHTEHGVVGSHPVTKAVIIEIREITSTEDFDAEVQHYEKLITALTNGLPDANSSKLKSIFDNL